MKKTILLLIGLFIGTVSCQSTPQRLTPVPLTLTANPPISPTVTLTPIPPTPVPLTLTLIPTTSTPAQSAASAIPTIEYAAIPIGNINRTYLYHVPADLPDKAPLLFVFHGYGYDATTLREMTGYEFDRLADQYGFIVVYPNGYETSWNDCRKLLPFEARAANIDDVAFVHALIAQFQTDYGIDTGRVFATGHSNGGGLSYRLALELPDEITAIAPVASSLPVEDGSICHPSGRPVPVLIMNGTGDPFMPYDGGLHTYFGEEMSPFRSTQETVDYFVKLNGLTNAPKTTRLPHQDASNPTSVDRIVWSEAGKPEIVLVKINGGGHIIPQPINLWPEQMGSTTGDVDGPVEIWDFFFRQGSAD